jgi:hypothetical protein
VVVRTPLGEVRDRRIPAGVVTLHGERSQQEVNVADGADAIMKALHRVRPLTDAQGEAGTNAGGMLARVRESMAELHGLPYHEVHISDLLAVNTFVPRGSSPWKPRSAWPPWCARRADRWNGWPRLLAKSWVAKCGWAAWKPRWRSAAH